MDSASAPPQLSDPSADPALRASLTPELKEPIHSAFNAAGAPRLLLADDDATSRRRMAAVISQWGFDVTAVADGPSALGALVAPDAPRMAVLDWEMPRMSGVDVCRLLRGRPGPYVYTLLLTGREGQRHLIDGLTAGADDYLKKPCSEQELEVRLRAGRRIVQLQESLLQAQYALEHRALHDGLTGVRNRGAVLDILEAELARAQRTAGSVAVILCDVDHFKRVNDTHGHAAGDTVLRSFCRTAQKCLRRYDTLGRVGGEEFLVVVPQCSSGEATRVAERLRRALAAKPIETASGAISVTASFGVATASAGKPDAQSLLAAADRALYAAKGNGRNCIWVQGPSSSASAGLPIAAQVAEAADRPGVDRHL